MYIRGGLATFERCSFYGNAAQLNGGTHSVSPRDFLNTPRIIKGFLEYGFLAEVNGGLAKGRSVALKFPKWGGGRERECVGKRERERYHSPAKESERARDRERQREIERGGYPFEGHAYHRHFLNIPEGDNSQTLYGRHRVQLCLLVLCLACVCSMFVCICFVCYVSVDMLCWVC